MLNHEYHEYFEQSFFQKYNTITCKLAIKPNLVPSVCQYVNLLFELPFLY